MSVLIRQAKVLQPSSEFHNKVVDILIEDGIIASIAANIDTATDQIIEAKGLTVSAGFVDVFADYREPGYEHKETIETGLKAAAVGGFTNVLLAPNTHPVVDSKSSVQYLTKKSLNNIVALHPLGAISQNIDGKALAEMHDMHSHGAIAFSDGWKAVQNAGLMLKALEYVKSFDGNLLQIPLDAALSSGGLMHEGITSTKLGMPGIPTLAETILIHRDIELLRYTQSRLHITGVSTAEGLAMIRKAKAEGLAITCSVTPYHLALNDEALITYDSVYKVSPVLRSEADRKALVEGLKDGTIDCIASHHRPQDWDSKTKEFEYAGDGMNLQEVAFSIVWQAVGNTVPLERLVDAFATKPRAIFGLPKMEIAKDNKAGITIFTTEESFDYSEQNVCSLSRNNPFIGQKLNGKILGIAHQNKIHLNK